MSEKKDAKASTPETCMALRSRRSSVNFWSQRRVLTVPAVRLLHELHNATVTRPSDTDIFLLLELL